MNKKRLIQMLIWLGIWWVWYIPGFADTCTPTQESYTLTWDSPQHQWKEGYRLQWRYYPTGSWKYDVFPILDPDVHSAPVRISADAGQQVELALRAAWIDPSDTVMRPRIRRKDRVFIRLSMTEPSAPVVLCWPGLDP